MQTLITAILQFVQIQNVLKLRICHQVAKHDPSVIVGSHVGPEDSASNNSDNPESSSDTPQLENSNTALVVYNPSSTTTVQNNPTVTTIVPHNPAITVIVPHNPDTLIKQLQQTYLATFQLKSPLLLLPLLHPSINLSPI